MCFQQLEQKYKATKAFFAIKTKVDDILKSARVSKVTRTKLLTKLLPLLISPAVKSKVKGDVFNAVIMKELSKYMRMLKMSRTRYNLLFESVLQYVPEKPDWYIHDKLKNSYLIGFNQIDLWSGGHQLNRGSKYILDECLHRRLLRKRIKLVCVVEGPFPCNMTKSSKRYKIITTGINKARLCHSSGLRDVLADFKNRKW